MAQRNSKVDGQLNGKHYPPEANFLIWGILEKALFCFRRIFSRYCAYPAPSLETPNNCLAGGKIMQDTLHPLITHTSENRFCHGGLRGSGLRAGK